MQFGKYVLKDYQEKAVEAFQKSRNGIMVVIPPGSGKSLVAHYLMAQSKGPILVVSSKLILLQHREAFPNALYVNSKQDYPAIATAGVVLFPVSRLLDEPREFIRIWDLIIIDESHLFKNYLSSRSRIMRNISKFGRKKLLLTATPRPENVGEYFPQICLIEQPNSLGKTNIDFDRMYSKKVMVGAFWKVVYHHQEEIERLAGQYIFTEPVKMPTQVHKDTPFLMSPKLQKAYDEARDDATVTLKKAEEENKIEQFFFVSALRNKLLQLCCGFFLDPITGEAKWLSREKADVVKTIISQHPGERVLVWSYFREEIKMLLEEIPDSGGVYGGSYGQAETLDAFKAGKIRVLVANPASIGAGISLECCRIQVICSMPESGVMYTQSIGRTNRLSQTHREIIYKIYPIGGVLKELYKNIANKALSEKEAIRRTWIAHLLGK